MSQWPQMQAHGFSQFDFAFDHIEKPVFKLGDDHQPAILIMLELPGMTRQTTEFAKRLHCEGYCIYLPLLFGQPDQAPAVVANLTKVCISREFHLLATHKPSPISDWLRALCGHMRQAHGGRKVGAIGMCFTGGFVLSLLVDEHVIAPVMTQPGHAQGLMTRRARATPGVPEAHIQAAQRRCKEDKIDILGARFTQDRLCPKSRFDQLEQLLGQHFIRIEIDSSLGNPHGLKPWDHSVFTLAYQDAEGHPTRQAYERLVAFFEQRLQPGTAE